MRSFTTWIKPLITICLLVTTAAGLECYVCSAKSPSADCMAGGSLQLAACEEDVTTCMHTVMANKTTNIPFHTTRSCGVRGSQGTSCRTQNGVTICVCEVSGCNGESVAELIATTTPTNTASQTSASSVILVNAVITTLYTLTKWLLP